MLLRIQLLTDGSKHSTDTRPFGDDDFHAVSVHLFRIQADAVYDVDHTWLWNEWVHQVPSSWDKIKRIAVLKVVGRHGLAGEILNFVDAQFRIQMDTLSRLISRTKCDRSLKIRPLNSDASKTVSVESHGQRH